jgi:hypothetical protein
MLEYADIVWETRKSLLETNVGVSDQEGAEDSIHDGVEGASGEGSNGEGDQADADSSVDQTVSNVVACMVRNSYRTSRKSSGSYPP